MCAQTTHVLSAPEIGSAVVEGANFGFQIFAIIFAGIFYMCCLAVVGGANFGFQIFSRIFAGISLIYVLSGSSGRCQLWISNICQLQNFWSV